MMRTTAGALSHTIAVFLGCISFLQGFSLVRGAEPGAHQSVIVFDRAEFVLSDARAAPGDEADWQSTALPHEWRLTHPGRGGIGWYRIRFELPHVPANAQAIMIAHARSYGFAVFVNENLLGDSGGFIARSSGLGTPVFLSIPPSLLRDGENVIRVRMNASSAGIAMHGLGRVDFGGARAVRNKASMAIQLGFNAERSFVALLLSAGLISLFLWFARRNDRVMLWFSIACLSWSVAGVLRHVLRWSDLLLLDSVLITYLRYGLVVPAVILCLRTVGLRHARFEVILGLFLMTEITYPLWLGMVNVAAILGLDIANTALLLAGAAVVLYAAPRPLRWSDGIQIAALILMATLMFEGVARYLGWIDVETPVFRHFHVPVMLIALGTAIFERHVLAMRQIDRMTVDLERRIEDKTREIEENHARVEQAKREHALALERQRILADMGDGLGASLTGLLRHVQSGGSGRGNIERRVQEVLQEMRIAIDALQAHAGDLASVLGNLRYRLDDMVLAAGVRLTWEVAELPTIEGLTSSTVFSLQRILVETITHALKHAGARQIALRAQAKDEDRVEIRIEHDGAGLDPSHPGAGMGLPGMRTRAERIGASIDVASGPDGGAAFSLVLPLKLATAFAGPVAGPLVPGYA